MLFMRAIVIVARLVPLAVVLALTGCVRVPDTMSDEEIRSKGLWSDGDAEARRLLDQHVGPGRPVRYAPYWRKLATPWQAIETLTGMSYDKRYYYVREEGVYVFPGRGDRGAFVVREDENRPAPERAVHVRP
jgi:hypothetical protein